MTDKIILSYDKCGEKKEPSACYSDKRGINLHKFDLRLFLPEIALIISLLAFVPYATVLLLNLICVDRYFPGYTSELMTSNAIGRYLFYFFSWTNAHFFSYYIVCVSIISIVISSNNHSKEANKVIFKKIAVLLDIVSLIASLALLFFMYVSSGV